MEGERLISKELAWVKGSLNCVLPKSLISGVDIRVAEVFL